MAGAIFVPAVPGGCAGPPEEVGADGSLGAT
jgi:hypothetical protein